MGVVIQSWKVEACTADGGDMLLLIERAGRTCYKSEGAITNSSAAGFVSGLIRRGHESVLEHGSVTVRIITDRGVTHELVRHRLASYSQESTRYCDYDSGSVVFIQPVWFNRANCHAKDSWLNACRESETRYKELRAAGWSPQEARTVLNNSLKTEIVMTANIREWRHFFRLRTSRAAHPQMRQLARDMLNGFQDLFPVLFDDINPHADD